MTTQTLEDCCRTYWGDRPISWDELTRSVDYGHRRIVQEVRDGLRTVIKTHITPMLAEAWRDGARCQHGIAAKYELCTDPEIHAASIEREILGGGA